MKVDVRLLAEKLWKNIKSLGRDRILELMKCPPILHDAAEAGNLYLINIITLDYPHLLSRGDSDGHTLLHTMVMHRRDNMLEVVKRVIDSTDLFVICRDKYGNNLLHAAAKSVDLEGLLVVDNLELKMERAHRWFQAVEEILPPYYRLLQNKKGYTPIQLFWKEHAEWLEISLVHTKKTAEICMLISTIVMTLVFTAGFSPPGGYSQDTGFPVLFMKKEFVCFIIFELIALFFSAISTIGFWDIIRSNYQDHHYILSIKEWLTDLMVFLLFSIFGIITAFLFASLLLFVHHEKVPVMSFICAFYVLFLVGLMLAFFRIQYAQCFNKIRTRSIKETSDWSSIISHVLTDE